LLIFLQQPLSDPLGEKAVKHFLYKLLVALDIKTQNFSPFKNITLSDTDSLLYGEDKTPRTLSPKEKQIIQECLDELTECKIFYISDVFDAYNELHSKYSYCSTSYPYTYLQFRSGISYSSMSKENKAELVKAVLAFLKINLSSIK